MLALEDTKFQSSMDSTLATYADLGFEAVLHENFVGNSFSDAEGPLEDYYLLWHPDGILGEVESYNTTGRNRSKIYYNLRRKNDMRFYYAIGSGHFHPESYDQGVSIWVGESDVRMGMRDKMSRFREVGEFVHPWVECPFLGLTTYAETRTHSYRELGWDAWRGTVQEITQARLDRLPDSVREAIGPFAR